MLTRDGIAFRDCARQFVSQCEAIGGTTRAQRRRQRPLRVFIGGHLLEDFLRPLLPEFHEEHPQLQMNFMPEKSRDQIMQDIPGGKVDVAVLTVPSDERPPGSLLVGTVPAGVFGVRAFGGPRSAADISMLPFILRRVGLDPASASAPFVATLVDLMGIVIYFTLASLILRGTLL